MNKDLFVAVVPTLRSPSVLVPLISQGSPEKQNQ